MMPGKKNAKKVKKWGNVEVVYTIPEEVIDGNDGEGKGSIEIFSTAKAEALKKTNLSP